MIAQDIADRTGRLFQASHWGAGSFALWNVEQMKATFCLVGGMRAVSLSDGTIEDVNSLNGRQLATHGWEDSELPEDSFMEYLKALRAVCFELGVGEEYGDVERMNLDDLENVLVEWNDEGDRTAFEVVGVLSKAADRL